MRNMRAAKWLAPGLIGLTFASDAWAYQFPANSNCPWFRPHGDILWKDYIAGKYNGGKPPPFGIRFNRVIGTIVTS